MASCLATHFRATKALCLSFVIASVSLSGCSEQGVQSVLHPASPASAAIAWLWWFILAVTSVVFVGVMLLTLVAILRRHRAERRPPLGGTPFVVAGGIVLPGVVLTSFLIASLVTSRQIRAPDRDLESDVTIKVVAHQFWWEVHYPDHGIVTANELHIPVGRTVRLELTSEDVIHSFWVPRLHGKMDMFPERTTEFWLTADASGVFRGQCAEYCGVQHAWMAFNVVALPSAEFDDWITARTAAPRDLGDQPLLARGRDAFFEHKCHTCHAIRGTRADARVGPDLTHLSSRSTIGAGILPNTSGNLAGWIANPQAIKPGNRMPRSYLPPADLHAVTAYLESLN